MPDIYQSPAAGENQPETLAATEKNEKAQARLLIDDILRRVGETKKHLLGGAYMVSPGKKFINEQEDEEIVLILRSHPITNIKWILISIGALLLPGLISLTGAMDDLPDKFVFLGKLFWYLGVMGYSFERFLDWYYSVFILTNERIVDIDFVNLLYRIVSYATLNHIEEPVMVAGGFIRSFFRYGDIFVATAAENPSIEARAVPYPDKVIKIISELSEELEKRRERGE